MSHRRVAWLMFLPRFDVLYAFQSIDPRQNEIYLFYTITKTFDHISRASIALTDHELSQKLSSKL